MGQITIYVNDETEKRMKNLIEKSGISKSKWIAGLIREKTRDTWPQNVTDLSGAWKDFPSLEEIRNDMGKDAARASIL
jgi:hypothetical protein